MNRFGGEEEEERTPVNRCPHCGVVSDARTQVGWASTSPSEGSVAVCVACTGVSFYTDTLGLRLPTGPEATELAGDPIIRDAQDRLVRMRVERAFWGAF